MTIPTAVSQPQDPDSPMAGHQVNSVVFIKQEWQEQCSLRSSGVCSGTLSTYQTGHAPELSELFSEHCSCHVLHMCEEESWPRWM